MKSTGINLNGKVHTITGGIVEEYDKETDRTDYGYEFYIDGNFEEQYRDIQTVIDTINYSDI